MMDMPATLQKRSASLPLNAEAHQPSASVGNISPSHIVHSAMPCTLRLPPSIPFPPLSKLLHSLRFKVSVVEWQRKNEAIIHRTNKRFSIKGGHNRERKCHIPRTSPPTLFTKAKFAKGVHICGTLSFAVCKNGERKPGNKARHAYLRSLKRTLSA